MPRLSTLLALAVVGWGLDGAYRAKRRRRVARPRATPEFLQTWEGEGGGVPVDTHRTAASNVRPDKLPALDDESKATHF